MSIFGHSMGGHGALILALKNPGKYKVRSSTVYMRYTNAYIDFCRCDRRKQIVSVAAVHCYIVFFFPAVFLNSLYQHLLPSATQFSVSGGRKPLVDIWDQIQANGRYVLQLQFFNNRWMSDLQIHHSRSLEKNSGVVLFYHTPKQRRALFVSGRSDMLLPYGAYENVMRYRSLIKSATFLSVLWRFKSLG